MSRAHLLRGKTVFEEAGETFAVAVNADDGMVTGTLDLVIRKAGSPPPTVEELLKILGKSKVKFVADIAERVVAELAKGPEISGLVVAEGKPPGKGAAGCLDWKIDIEAGKKQAVKIVDGLADYRAGKEILQVREGQELLRIVPPEAGLPGEDILGRAIPGIEGDAADIDLGKHVGLRRETSTAFAEAGGAIVFQGNRISISPVYIVQEDLTQEVGNIDFLGEVLVKGDVRDDLEVRSGANITVTGAVNAARLESAADISIQMGASGQGRGELVAGGKIQARYLNGLSVVCRGDLVIQSEIVNCTVRCGGLVSVPMGRIIGGEIVALHHVEARQIGSSSNIPTKITIGIDPETAEAIAQLKARLAAIHKEMDWIYLSVKAHLDDPSTIANVPERKRKTVQSNIDTYTALRRQKQECEAQLAKLETTDVDPNQQYVKVLRTLFGNVTLAIGGYTQVFPLEVPGPVTYIVDLEKGCLRKCR